MVPNGEAEHLSKEKKGIPKCCSFPHSSDVQSTKSQNAHNWDKTGTKNPMEQSYWHWINTPFFSWRIERALKSITPGKAPRLYNIPNELHSHYYQWNTNYWKGLYNRIGQRIYDVIPNKEAGYRSKRRCVVLSLTTYIERDFKGSLKFMSRSLIYRPLTTPPGKRHHLQAPPCNPLHINSSTTI